MQKQKVLFLFIFLLSLSSLDDFLAKAFAQAEGCAPTMGWCSQGYRRDSYGAGINQVMTGKNALIPWKDDVCVMLGERKAKEIINTYGKRCNDDYTKGFKSGYSMTGYFTSSSACEMTGYEAGMASLRNSARAGAGPDRCAEMYESGYASVGGSAGSIPVENANVLGECYRTGADDASIVKF